MNENVQPIFQEPPPAPLPSAGQPEEEFLLGKWQTAQTVHQCNGCVEDILPGENYLRMVNIGGLRHAVDGYSDRQIGRRVWDMVARKGLPIEKFHEACAHYEITHRRRVLRRLV